MKRAVVAIAIVAVIAIAWMVLANNNENQPVQNKSTNQTGNTNNTKTPNNNNKSNISEAAAAQQIRIADRAFSPKEVTVTKGTKVTWNNSDGVNHDIKKNNGNNGPNSPLLSQGQSYSYTYDEVGTFNYYCSIHSEMTGTVTVTE